MATNEDFFQYSARWHELRNLATADPDDEVFTDRLVALLEERDKELEHFLQNRVTTVDLGGGGYAWSAPAFHVAGRWYRAVPTGDPDLTTSITQNRVYYCPWVMPYDCTLTDIAVDLISSGGNLRMGIYANDATGIWKPGALIANFGVVSPPAGGGAEINSLTQAISAGVVYWLAYQSDTARSMAGLGSASTPSSGLLNSGTNTPTRAAYTSDTYASGFPSTAGTLVADTTATTPSFRFKIS